jgi:hypothetical protein
VHAEGRAAGQQRITDYTTEREKSGDPELMACGLMRPIFDEHARQVDTLRQQLDGDTAEPGDNARAERLSQQPAAATRDIPAQMQPAPLPPPQKQTAPPPINFKTYDNVDALGGDRATLKNIELPDCVAACRSDSECAGYSYDKWNKWCFTKTALNELIYSARSLTALREDAPKPTMSRNSIHFERFRNRGFPRQSQQRQTAQSFEQCEAICGQTEWCAALTFYKSTRECQLLRTTGEYFPNSDADSAAKSQAN